MYSGWHSYLTLRNKLMVMALDWTSEAQRGEVICPTEREVLVAQLCPTLCDPIHCSLPGSSVHGILQAIIVEWVAISFSISNPGIEPGSAVLQEDSLPSEPPGKPLIYPKSQSNLQKIISVVDPSNDIDMVIPD